MRWAEEYPKTEADWSQVELVLRRKVPQRVPVVELFTDHDFIQAVLGYHWTAVAADKDYAEWQRYWLWRIEYQKLAGPAYINAGMDGLVYPVRKVACATNTAELALGDRAWVNETEGVITRREDFESYPWPTSPFNRQQIDFIAENAPPGMGIIMASSGILEWAMWLMSFETFSTALHDQPELVRDVVDRVGERFVDFYGQAARHEAVRALWIGDDLGFKTATMISPHHLREYIFPWHRRIAEAAHAAGKPFLLHACGNIDAVMEDLIEYVGIDARHSFEDVIEPVTSVKRRYGHRIAIIGGVDVDFISRRSEQEVRQYVRRVLEECTPGGGYAVGTGNSVANYIPIRNYVAMLQEVAAFNRER
jgi:uroporphyrinogen decarboxylase